MSKKDERPWLFEWRAALLSERGPKATTRHVLLVLSTHGDLAGVDIFPSTRLLAVETGLARKNVMKHLQAAEEQGWIHRQEAGTAKGQGWRRHTYTLTVPNVVTESDHLPKFLQDDEDEQGGNPEAQGGNSGDPKVVTLGDLTSPPVPLHPTSPSAELRVQRTDRSDERPVRREKMDKIIELIERHNAVRLATEAGMIPRDAQWVIEGVGHAQEAGMVDGAGGMDAYDLAAEALYDLQRKHKMFTREMFVAWVEQAIKVRALDDSDVIDDCELAREAWPVKRRSQGSAR